MLTLGQMCEVVAQVGANLVKRYVGRPKPVKIGY